MSDTTAGKAEQTVTGTVTKSNVGPVGPEEARAKGLSEGTQKLLAGARPEDKPAVAAAPETAQSAATTTEAASAALPAPLSTLVSDENSGTDVDGTLRDLAATEPAAVTTAEATAAGAPAVAEAEAEDPREALRKTTRQGISDRYLEDHQADADREATLAANLNIIDTSEDISEVLKAKEALGLSFTELSAMLPENDGRGQQAKETDAKERRDKILAELEESGFPEEQRAEAAERFKKLQNADGSVSDDDRVAAAVADGLDRGTLERVLRNLGCEGDLTDFLDKVDAAKAAAPAEPGTPAAEPDSPEEVLRKIQEDAAKLAEREEAGEDVTADKLTFWGKIRDKIKDMWKKSGINKKNWWIYALVLVAAIQIGGTVLAVKTVGTSKKGGGG